MICFQKKDWSRSVRFIATGSFLALLFFGAATPESAAQTTAVATLEWEAESSRPAGYNGKALASPGTWVTVTLLPLFDTPTESLRPEWFLDGTPVSTSDPLKIRFIATRDPGGNHTVLARLRNVKTQATEELTLPIPVVQPQVLIYGLGKNGWPQPQTIDAAFSFPKGSSFTLLARSYFLPGSKAVFRWLKNGQEIKGAPKNPDMLLVSAPSNAVGGSRESIQAVAQHPQFPGLTAIKEVVVEIK